ncbi:hypothetical protein NBRC116493_08480 [Aurantivibrio infirmus]
MSATFDKLIAQQDQQIDICVTFILLWIAASDGAVDIKEHEFIHKYFGSLAADSAVYEKLMRTVADNEIDSLIAAFKALKFQLKNEERDFFIDIAIGMSVVSGHISISQNHILRLCSDLLGFPKEYLAKKFLKKTGEALPELGDPSSVDWWFEEEGDPYESTGWEDSTASKETMGKSEAYRILGVSRKASALEIKRAYRKLAQHHHPDRHQDKDSDSIEAAELAFLRIRHAYETLKL